jgi:hypothetical protein
MFKNCFTLLFLSVFFVTTAQVQVMKKDTAKYEHLLKQKVQIIAEDGNSGVWVVAGDSLDKLYHINKRNRIKNVSNEAKLPSNSHFTNLLSLNDKDVFLGTDNDYVYCINKNRYVKIDNSSGLADKSISLIQKDRTGKYILIKTQNAAYAVFDLNNNKCIGVAKISDSINFSEPPPITFDNYVKLPIQRAFCKAMSKIDYSITKQKLIREKELKLIKSTLIPGDIILKRNDYQVANWGIPGFWTHSGIYIGGEIELNAYFDNLPMLNNMKASEYIQTLYPQIYKLIKDKKSLIIEAVAEGVVINPLEHIAEVDYFAALRTSISKEKQFMSLLIAFSNYNKPYDFLFDFDNDNYFVCSELVYKSFKPNGVNFKLGTLNGKPFLSPNDIAKQFSEEYVLTNPQFRLVIFYDRDYKKRKSYNNNELEFSKTWLR